MADWSVLRSALGRADDSVHFTWDELDALVGGLPASATNHRAWWSGNRTHVNAWREAGSNIANLVPGREVTFVRGESGSSSMASSLKAEAVESGHAGVPTLLLVACVKEK